MRSLRIIRLSLLASFVTLAVVGGAVAADHNDPNSVNSIFSDVPVSAADLYDMFGWPADDTTGGEKVVLALTFAAIPETGVFDTDMLYKIHLDPDPRVGRPAGEQTLEGIVHWAESLAKKYKTSATEIRVRVDGQNRAKVSFIGFPGGTFTETVDTNKVLTINTPDGHAIKTFIGGRDDAFFNDLPGFFRSINYAPQFYHVPLTADRSLRELRIPKTLLELEGNTLFNYDPANPHHGAGVKTDLPAGPHALNPTAFKKDAKGNYRFVYSGTDAQAGRNINAIVFEVPLAFITKQPQHERVVNAWGESWVRRASDKIETIPDHSGRGFFTRIGDWFRRTFGKHNEFEQEIAEYKRVDTDGIPFADAGLAEREDSRQLGANNLRLSRHFVIRFGHLGWGFGPSVSALGLPTCFDHSNATVSKVEFYHLATAAFPRVKRCFFQHLNMPDDSWNKGNKHIPLKTPLEIFIPNVNPIDMDTTGTWPYGRRLEDQVATRFLSTFLDHTKQCGAKPCNIETLGDQALWDSAPIEPKTPPNPLRNDTPFLKEFPYLAAPWPTPPPAK